MTACTRPVHDRASAHSGVDGRRQSESSLLAEELLTMASGKGNVSFKFVVPGRLAGHAPVDVLMPTEYMETTNWTL